MRGITLRAIKVKVVIIMNIMMKKKKKNLRKYHIGYEHKQRIDSKHNNAFQIIFIEIMDCKFCVYLSPFVA